MPSLKIRGISGLMVLAACALFIGGCAKQYADPGPDPARVKISFQAGVSKAQVQSTLADNQLTPPIVLPGLFHQVTGPFWDWSLYTPGPSETWAKLEPLGTAPLKRIPGDSLTAGQTFAAPPGKVMLRLLVECYMVHSWSEGMGPTQYQPVAVSQYTRQWNRELKPGSLLELNLGTLTAADK